MKDLGCSKAFIYAMGQEPWLKFLTGAVYAPDSAPIRASDRLISQLRERSITAERWYGRREWHHPTRGSHA